MFSNYIPTIIYEPAKAFIMPVVNWSIRKTEEAAIKFGVYTASQQSATLIASDSNEISPTIFEKAVELALRSPDILKKCAESKAAELTCDISLRAVAHLQAEKQPFLDIASIAAPRAVYLITRNRTEYADTLDSVVIGGTLGHIAGTYAETFLNNTFCDGDKSYAGYVAYSIVAVSTDLTTRFMYNHFKKKLGEHLEFVNDYINAPRPIRF